MLSCIWHKPHIKVPKHTYGDILLKYCRFEYKIACVVGFINSPIMLPITPHGDWHHLTDVSVTKQNYKLHTALKAAELLLS